MHAIQHTRQYQLQPRDANLFAVCVCVYSAHASAKRGEGSLHTTPYFVLFSPNFFEIQLKEHTVNAV